ncbi:hypothetical protein ACYIJ4_12195, partial [Enterococcus faecium]
DQEELIHLISNYSKISLYQHHLTKSQKNHFFFWYHHALSFYWLFVFQPFITQVLHVIIVRQRF